MVIPRFDNIPEELRALKQWVCWRYVRGTKPPFRTDGRLADSTRADTWASFAAVVAAYHGGGFNGVGFVLTAKDLYTAFDFDHCLDAGNITNPRIADYVSRLNSYTEITPSSEGLRIIVRAKLPPGGRKKGHYECYDSARYITLTGHLYGASPLPIADRQAVVDVIHAEIFPAREQQSTCLTSTSTSTLGDETLLISARAAANGTRFAALYDAGDWRGQGFPSQSEADLWLAGSLAFWTCCDLSRMERLFRSSALGQRRKSNRTDYLTRTLTKAINECTQMYAGQKNAQ